PGAGIRYPGPPAASGSGAAQTAGQRWVPGDGGGPPAPPGLVPWVCREAVSPLAPAWESTPDAPPAGDTSRRAAPGPAAAPPAPGGARTPRSSRDLPLQRPRWRPLPDTPPPSSPPRRPCPSTGTTSLLAPPVRGRSTCGPSKPSVRSTPTARVPVRRVESEDDQAVPQTLRPVWGPSIWSSR